MLAAAILAAGESRRMGTPKALLPFPATPLTPGKATFLEHLVSIAQHPRIGELRVVLGAHAEQVRNRVELKPEWVVINERWEDGQLSSIHAAIRSLPPGTDGLMLFLVDHPLISPGVVGRLVEAYYDSAAAVVVPTFEGRRGHPVIFASRLYDELLNAHPDTGARAVVWAHAKEVVEVPTQEEGVVLNLNDAGSLKDAFKERN